MNKEQEILDYLKKNEQLMIEKNPPKGLDQNILKLIDSSQESASKRNYWLSTGGALAASVLLMAFVWLGGEQTETPVTQMIAESQKLEKLIAKNKVLLDSSYDETRAQMLEMRINLNASMLEDLYKTEQADDLKMKYWQQRLQQLNQLNSVYNTSDTIYL